MARIEALPARHPPVCTPNARHPRCVKRVKLIGLCLTVAFAGLAVALAGSASAAEPEWGHCEPIKSKGHFEDSNCAKEDFKENKAHERKYKGHFEWYAGAAATCYGQKKGHYEDSACTKEDFKENSKTHEKKYKGHFEKTGGAKFAGEGGAGVLKSSLFECETRRQVAGPAKTVRGKWRKLPEQGHERDRRMHHGARDRRSQQHRRSD